MYTLPNFNLLVTMWRSGLDPRFATPTQIDIPAQMYIFSRQWIAHHEADINYLVPSIQLRFPIGSFSPSMRDTYQIQGRPWMYYNGVWAERVHVGFPNEYFTVVCVQADDTASVPRQVAKWDTMT